MTGARSARGPSILAIAVLVAALMLVAVILIRRPGSTAIPGGPAATLAIVPATAGPGSAILVGAGDIASCGEGGDEQTAAILDVAPGTVFTLGDNAYEDGTKAEYERCYATTWGRQLDRTRPSPGNHEYDTRGATGYFDYFGARAGEGATGYYAYDLDGWRIYSLNSNCSDIGGCGEGSAELDWLRADLEAHPSRCSLAYWHHPRFSSGEHGDNPVMDPIWEALATAGTEVVLAGHDHDYERFAAMGGGGAVDTDRGITSFVVGTGGKDFRDFQAVATNSVVRNADTWGVLELALSATRWSARFIPVAGSTFTDRAEGACH